MTVDEGDKCGIICANAGCHLKHNPVRCPPRVPVTERSPIPMACYSVHDIPTIYTPTANRARDVHRERSVRTGTCRMQAPARSWRLCPAFSSSLLGAPGARISSRFSTASRATGSAVRPTMPGFIWLALPGWQRPWTRKELECTRRLALLHSAVPAPWRSCLFARRGDLTISVQARELRI